jgi:hypothetical protein
MYTAHFGYGEDQQCAKSSKRKPILEIGYCRVQIFREPLLPAGNLNVSINIINFVSILISINKLAKNK